MSCPYTKKYLNGHRVIFLHLYEEKDKWIYHFISYLEKILNYRYQKFNEVLGEEN